MPISNHKKAIIITPAAKVALPDSIFEFFFRRSIITGMDPRISMIENSFNANKVETSIEDTIVDKQRHVLSVMLA
jgi:hypothetical protein